MRAAMSVRLLAGLFLLTASERSRADDVSDQINEALKAYDAHNLSATAAALEAAGNLIRQQKAEQWKAMLPEALPGWTAADADSSTMGSAMLGGGTNVSRNYARNDQTVEISFIADSPLMQGLGSLLGGGLIGGSNAKLLIISGRKVTYNKSENSYSAMLGKVLVSVKGHGVSDDVLRAYLTAIKFDAVEKASLE